MPFLFWSALLLVLYTYAGYPLLLAALARLRPRPVHAAPFQPTVSLIMAARNEAHNLPAKLANLQQLTYPSHLLDLLIVSDGSTDGTDDLLTDFAARSITPPLTPILLPTSGGKALALNAAVAQARGEVLVFLDLRQQIDPGSVSALIENLADPTVGAVSGELLLLDSSGAPAGDALGLYWRIEKLLRRLESLTGSVVGVTGAIYALRRSLFRPLPAGLILDDVLVPMQAARSGQRILFESRAIARDRIFTERGKEFSRKVRTLTGNYQLLHLAPWLLSPTANPLLLRFVSHKLLRLLVPALLCLMLGSSALATGWFFHLVFALQIVFYLLALLGSLLPRAKQLRPIAIAHTFVLLNAAAAVALYNFLTGRDQVWT